MLQRLWESFLQRVKEEVDEDHCDCERRETMKQFFSIMMLFHFLFFKFLVEELQAIFVFFYTLFYVFFFFFNIYTLFYVGNSGLIFYV